MATTTYTTSYKGFELSPASEQLQDTGEWSVRVTITKHHDSRGETLEKQYSANNTFKKKDDAEHHSIEYGKEIIDGKHKNVSVKDLL